MSFPAAPWVLYHLCVSNEFGMTRRKRAMALAISALIVTAIFVLRMLRVGNPLSEVLSSGGAFCIFLSIPIFRTLLSARSEETNVESQFNRKKLLLRILITYVACPLLIGLIYFVAPPFRLEFPPDVIVLVIGSIFSFYFHFLLFPPGND